MKIYAVKIEQVEEKLFDRMLLYVSKEEQERIRRYRKYEDAIRGLTARLLLRYIIASLLGIDNRSISLNQNKYGKPFLEEVEDFQFNLSHSGDWVVCAVDSLPIGIDVEKIHDVNLDLSERFFSQEEHNWLLTMDVERRMDSFFKLWTLKESYIKAEGKGLSIPLNTFSFSFEGEKVLFKAKDDLEQWYFKQYEIDLYYKLAVCSKKDHFPERVNCLSFDELVNLAKNHLKELDY